MARASRTRKNGAVRARAATIVDVVLESRSPARHHLESAAVGLVARDRRFLWELTLGSLRWLRRLDWVLEQAADRPLDAIEPKLLAPLRVGAYQLLFLRGVPAYAAVNEAVADTRRRRLGRASGFVNAVLRAVGRRSSLDLWPVEVGDELERLAIEHSYPTPLVEKWREHYGHESAVGLLTAGNQRRRPHLLCLADRERVAAELESEGVATVPCRLSPYGLRVIEGDPLASGLLHSGSVYVQDDASQAAALVPLPAPGESAFDAAAAPGGKTLALRAAEPTVRSLSGDLSLERTLRLRENLRRSGEFTGKLLVADASRPAAKTGFDRVVLDLPCSGSGTLARHPELKWRISEAELSRLAVQGEQILTACAPLARPGGLICAITCSLEPEENEEVVRAFLARNDGYEPVDLDGRVPSSCADGIRGPGLWRVLTTPEHDGFTVHVLRRYGS